MPRNVTSFIQSLEHGLIVLNNDVEKEYPSMEDYIEAAIFGEIKSRSDVANEIGVTSQALSMWIKGVSHPKDEHMIRLANLLRVNEETALLHLNIWRTHGKAQLCYQKIASKLAAAAAAFLGFLLIPDAAFAAAQIANRVTSEWVSLYIM